MSAVETVTVGQLNERIAAILSEFPRLRDYSPSCRCGSAWCSYRADDLSSPEVHAYEVLAAWRYLLGGDS